MEKILYKIVDELHTMNRLLERLCQAAIFSKDDARNNNKDYNGNLKPTTKED